MLKLAFSTVACPEWTLDEAAGRAAAMGYAGLELRTLGPGSTGLSCDPALSEPAAVKDALAAHDIQPICLSTSIALHHAELSEARQAERQTMAALDLAAAIGCPAVRLFGNRVEPGQSRRSVLTRIADRVRPLADKAAERGVTILFENAGSLAHAKDWWTLTNLLEHPGIRLAWNLANGVVANPEDAGGDVAITMLNHRIRLVKLKDTVASNGSGFVPLGDGDVNVNRFIRRLLGIGYDGWLSVEWDRLWLPHLTDAATYLPDAKARIDAIVEQIELAALSPKELKEREAKKKAADEAKKEKAEAPAPA